MAEQRPRRALVQYAAAALLAELKHLAAPVSIHLPPLDLDVEDHGTVAPSVVFTTRRALHLLDTILTCEAQMAIDLMDVQGVPGSGAARGEAYERVRAAWEAAAGRGTRPRSRSRRRAPPCASTLAVTVRLADAPGRSIRWCAPPSTRMWMTSFRCAFVVTQAVAMPGGRAAWSPRSRRTGP